MSHTSLNGFKYQLMFLHERDDCESLTLQPVADKKLNYHSSVRSTINGVASSQDYKISLHISSRSLICLRNKYINSHSRWRISKTHAIEGSPSSCLKRDFWSKTPKSVVKISRNSDCTHSIVFLVKDEVTVIHRLSLMKRASSHGVF